MEKYRVSIFHFDWFDGSRILMCTAFSINPFDSLEAVVDWIKNLDCSKPDFIQISYIDDSCLFDNDDTRIVNNVFYCKRH